MNTPIAADPLLRKFLPFRGIWPLLAGAFGGLMLRLAFHGAPGERYAAMMASFICLAPLLVGALTVYVAERVRRRSWRYYLWAPVIANLFFVTGTLLLMMEGWICAPLIVPLFSIFGSVGGLVMGLV